MSPKAAPDPEKLNQFLGKFLEGMGAIVHGPTILIGEELGLYAALGRSDGMSSGELARATETDERLVREWLCSQATAGFVESTAGSDRFSMNAEQAFALADASSPAYLPGALLLATSLYKDWPKVAQAFRTGKGMAWDAHSPELFEGTDRFFRNAYVANLLPHWIPALDGVVARLEKGSSVADVGCGRGTSTILMAQAFPNSRFFGFDYHAPSVRAAAKAAEKAGVGDRATFAVASSDAYGGKEYGLVGFFDCLHDMGDPERVAKYVLSTLAKDGTWMIVEPFAGETLAENMTPVGRVSYGASTQVCIPASLAQPGRRALGAQAGDSQYAEIVRNAGFTRFRRAFETPFNRIFEARP
jgi:SAM-dependent methyltransferase